MLCITEYRIVEDSVTSCNFIRSASECNLAASKLNLSDLSATIFTWGRANYPPFCHIVNDGLYFNAANTGQCTANLKCICH